FVQAEDGIRDFHVTGVQTCALPIFGNSGQRQGLTVHSLNMDPGAGGAWNYTLTLTQNLKKAKVSKGEVTLRIDGVRAGKLDSLQDRKSVVEGKSVMTRARRSVYTIT